VDTLRAGSIEVDVLVNNAVHYNARRPHRERDILGGLIHEYELAA
jgi:hypothetical protein